MTAGALVNRRTWLVVTSALALFQTGCHRMSASDDGSRERPARGIAAPSTVDFGVVAAGAKDFHIVKLINRGAEPQGIESIRASCPCLSADLSAKIIRPYDNAYARVRLDLSKLGCFAGEFSADVAGFDSGGNGVLHFEVRAYVVPASELPWQSGNMKDDPEKDSLRGAE